MNLATIWRVIWPDRGPLFVVVGGVVSLLSDFASFLANIASPHVLIWPIAALAGLLGWLCFGRVAAPAVADGPAEDAVQCRECDAFRVMLFAAAGVGLLLMAGQGQTATERFGRQLGLIQADVAAIRDDTSAIRDVTASSELIRNPRTPAEHFRNAWIYSYVHRDAERAWASAQAIYRGAAPNKLDAAEI